MRLSSYALGRKRAAESGLPERKGPGRRADLDNRYFRSATEETLAWLIKAERLPEPVREYRFAPPRRYKFDFCWPELKVAAECEGGIWTYGRHNRASGYENDCEKYNLAAELGYCVQRFTTAMVDDGRAIEALKRVLSHD